MHIYIYTHIIHVYTHIYIYREREKEKEREREREMYVRPGRGLRAARAAALGQELPPLDPPQPLLQ